MRGKIELALQSELNLQAQLRDEIQKLEEKHTQSSCTPAALKFYHNSLNKVQIDTEELNTEITQYESVYIPELETKLQRGRHMKTLAMKHIDRLDHLCQITAVGREVTEDRANEIITCLEQELAGYDQVLDSERKELRDLKQTLRQQQDKKYQERKAWSERFWHDEVESEKTIKERTCIHHDGNQSDIFKQSPRSYHECVFRSLRPRRRNLSFL